MSGDRRPLRVVLFGDGESPHLLKWALALAPRVELFVASSRGLAPALAALLPPKRTLLLSQDTKFAGGNAALLKTLPGLVRWLRGVDADWINAHYLTSHGTLAWLARRCGVRARLAASAWGSDILVTPDHSALLRWVTSRVLRDASLCTSDSEAMARRMRELGAREVMTFPFGLDALPPEPTAKEPRLFFANRGLEEIYDPMRVLSLFAGAAAAWPDARLMVANGGSLREALEARASALGLDRRIEFVGRLDAVSQSAIYARARWYVSVPRSDSVSVSVLEAMGHGCIPLLSDLPANRELVRDGGNGLVVADGVDAFDVAALERLAADAPAIAAANRAWVGAHALFGPCVDAFVARLEQCPPAPGRTPLSTP
ncbi:MAG: glycosyltransferase [Burkholderiales bacterium]|nr:glycosyltransferase [Burkholderiales bacterium]